MRYDQQEGLEQQFPAVELFEFLYAGVWYYYTSYQSNVSYGGNTYLSRYITRQGISVQKSLSVPSMTIKCEALSFFASFILTPTPIQIIIRRMYLDTPYTAKALFYGFIHNLSLLTKEEYELIAISKAELLKTVIPTSCLQALCNNTLFDTQCNLNSTLYDVSAVISAVNDPMVYSPTFATKPNGYFTYGKLVFDQWYRPIINHIGNGVELSPRIGGVVGYLIGKTVHVWPGCDKQFTTCQTKFLSDNSLNFAGMVQIPVKNISSIPISYQ